MEILLVPSADLHGDSSKGNATAASVDRLAAAIHELAQASGCGLPSRMARAFAQLLTGLDDEDSLFRRFLEALHAELARAGLPLSRAATMQALAEDPFRATQSLLAPLAFHMDAKIGRIVLGCAPELAQASESAVHRHAEEWSMALLALIGSEDPFDRAWLASAAIQLWQAIHQPEVLPPGPIDRLGRQIYLAIGRADAFQAPPDRATITRHHSGGRAGAKPQMDGVIGIRHAGSTEDPLTMLPSFQALPDLWLQDRLLNEGFLAFDRPPPAPIRRKLLCAAIAEGLPEGVERSMLRAAWWECCRTIELALAEQRPAISLVWLSTVGGHLQRDLVAQSVAAGPPQRSVDSRLRYLATFTGEGMPFLASSSKPPQAANRSVPHFQGEAALIEELGRLGDVLDQLDLAMILRLAPEDAGELDSQKGESARTITQILVPDPRAVLVQLDLRIAWSENGTASCRLVGEGGKVTADFGAVRSLPGTAGRIAGALAQNFLKRV